MVRTVTQWLSRTDGRADSRVAVPATKWHLLDFDGVSDSDVVMKTFVRTMAELGHVTHLRPAECTWQLDLTGGWDGFLSRQSRTQRTQARNFVNRFDKSSDLRLQIASQSGPQVDSMIAALMNLHQERWRAVGVEGSFTDARMRSFFESAMREMVARGSAEILSLERNGRPIVVQMNGFV